MVFRNTLAQSSSAFVGYLFSFVLAPIMITRLGLEAFGVWAVTGALATYAGLLDLGIGRSLARFIAVYDADGDQRRVRECVGLGLAAVAVVGLLATVAGLVVAPLLSDQLGVLSTDEMRIVVLASVGIWTFGGVGGVLAAVGIGKREMVPPNIATTVGATLNFAFSITALALSSSLVVYAVANAAAALLAILPMFLAMRYLWHAPYVAVPSRVLVREVVVFSMKNQVGWFADLINLQTDKLIIAAVVDVRAVAVYEIASRVVLAVRSASILTVSALIPTTAAEIVSRGRDVIGEFYSHYNLRSCSIAFPLFMLVVVSAPFLLVAWLGEIPGDAALLVPALTLAYLVNITTGVGSTIAIAAGHPGFVSLNSLMIAGLNVALTLALGPWLGLWGVVAGTSIALSVGSAIFTVRFLKLFDLPARDFLDGVLPTGALAIGLALPLAPVALLVGLPDGRLPAALLLVAVTAAYALPYWLLASRLGYLPERLRVRGRRLLSARGRSYTPRQVIGQSKSRRVLLVVNVLGWAGAETQLRHLAAGLSRLGWSVTVLAMQHADPDVAPLSEPGVRVVTLSTRGRAGKLRATAEIARLARRADIVHCTGWDASLWGRLGAIAARRPVVVTEHSPGRDLQVSTAGGSRQRAIAVHNRLLDRATAATIIVAAWQGEVLQGEGVRRSSIVHIPNAVPLEDLRRRAELGPSRADLGIPEDSTLLVHSARFSPQKGQPISLRAVARLRERLGDVRLIFAGRGAEEEQVKRLASEIGAEWATFLGWRDDVPGLLRMADLAVLPSSAEALPMSLIEAMAVGTPVVATDVGDVRWLLEYTGGGISVPAGDDDAFTAACAEVLGDPDLHGRLAAAALRGAEDFDAELMARRYGQVFDAVVDSTPLPHPMAPA